LGQPPLPFFNFQVTLIKVYEKRMIKILVSWDDYSQYMEKQKKTNHQPGHVPKCVWISDRVPQRKERFMHQWSARKTSNVPFIDVFPSFSHHFPMIFT